MEVEFLYKRRPDDTFVISVNGLPYQVIESDPLYEPCVEAYEALNELPPDEPPPAPPQGIVNAPVVLSKADLWRKLTNEEADAVDEIMLNKAVVPTRLRRIFEAAQYIDPADPDYPSIVQVLQAAIGPERAAEVLALPVTPEGNPSPPDGA